MTDRQLSSELPGVSSGQSQSIPLKDLLELDSLLATYKGRTAFVQRLLDALLASQATTPSKLREAAAQADFKGLGFMAHNFAGAVGALHGHALRAQAKDVERLAASCDPDACACGRQLADRIDTLLSAVQRSSLTDLSSVS